MPHPSVIVPICSEGIRFRCYRKNAANIFFCSEGILSGNLMVVLILASRDFFKICPVRSKPCFNGVDSSANCFPGRLGVLAIGFGGVDGWPCGRGGGIREVERRPSLGCM